MRYFLFFLICVPLLGQDGLIQENEKLLNKIAGLSYSEQITVLNEVIGADSSSCIAMNLLGVAYFRVNDNEKALAILNNAIERCPELVTPYNNRGNVFNDLKLYEDAINDFDLILYSYPNDTIALTNKGNSLKGLGRFNEAKLLYQRASLLNPQMSIPYYNIGDCYYSNKEFRKALTYFIKSDSLGYKPSEMYDQMGYAYHKLNNETLSFYYHDLAVKLDSTNLNALFHRATSLSHLEDYENAILDFNKLVIKNYEFYLGVLNSRGYSYTKLGRYDLALKDLQEALELNETAFALNNIGYVYFKLGKNKKAFKLINQSIKIDSTNSYAYRNKAIIYKDVGDFEKGCKCALRADELGFATLYSNEIKEYIQAHCWE